MSCLVLFQLEEGLEAVSSHIYWFLLDISAFLHIHLQHSNIFFMVLFPKIICSIQFSVSLITCLVACTRVQWKEYDFLRFSFLYVNIPLFIMYLRKWSDEIIWICNLDIMEMQKYVSFYSILKEYRIFRTWNAGIMEMKFWVCTGNNYNMLLSVQASVPAWVALRSLSSFTSNVGSVEQSVKWFIPYKVYAF